MGSSKKDKIAQLREKTRKSKAPKTRKENTKDEKVRFLIVCEGAKTEPLYFKALIKDKVSAVREVNLEDGCMNTVSLVKKTKEIKKNLEQNNNMSFDRVWVVFDEDDNKDFNNAINMAEQFGFYSAWSNEAFELWYFLHFEYLDTAITRGDYIDRIEKSFRKANGKKIKYAKNNPDNYSLLQQYGSEDKAKKNAQKLRELYNDKNYSKHKPCTMVDLLVEELENPIKVLQEIRKTKKA